MVRPLQAEGYMRRLSIIEQECACGVRMAGKALRYLFGITASSFMGEQIYEKETVSSLPLTNELSEVVGLLATTVRFH